MRMSVHFSTFQHCRRRNLVGGRADITGAHQQQQIAIGEQRRQRVTQIARMFDEDGIGLAARAYCARERAAVRVCDRRFSCRIHIGEHEHVDIREHVGEIIEQIARTRVTVRLERDDKTLIRPAAACGGEYSGEFTRMVAVVVDE